MTFSMMEFAQRGQRAESINLENVISSGPTSLNPMSGADKSHETKQ